VEGDHNSLRPSFFTDSVVIFFINTLAPPLHHEQRGFNTSGEELVQSRRPAFGNADKAQQQQLKNMFGNQENSSGNDSPRPRAFSDVGISTFPSIENFEEVDGMEDMCCDLRMALYLSAYELARSPKQNPQPLGSPVDTGGSSSTAAEEAKPSS